RRTSARWPARRSSRRLSSLACSQRDELALREMQLRLTRPHYYPVCRRNSPCTQVAERRSSTRRSKNRMLARIGACEIDEKILALCPRVGLLRSRSACPRGAHVPRPPPWRGPWPPLTAAFERAVTMFRSPHSSEDASYPPPPCRSSRTPQESTLSTYSPGCASGRISSWYSWAASTWMPTRQPGRWTRS